MALADAKALYKRTAKASYFYTGDIWITWVKAASSLSPTASSWSPAGRTAAAPQRRGLFALVSARAGGCTSRSRDLQAGWRCREIDPLHFFVSSSVCLTPHTPTHGPGAHPKPRVAFLIVFSGFLMVGVACALVDIDF